MEIFDFNINEAIEDTDEFQREFNNGEYHRKIEQWPVLSADALHGLAGEIVSVIDPYTESDRVATLLNILTAFGNCINFSAYATVQHDKHPTRLFVVMVGDTSKGRKGTGWSTPRHIFSLCDPDWTKDRIKGGLSSGEGLIYNVRDPVSVDRNLRS